MKSSRTLPPRHGGYRASGSTTTVSRSAKSGAYIKLPKPPKGQGGGSKKDQAK
jgi:hypothetical protein